MQKNNLIVGVSGGKDSTAVCLHLKEQGYSSKDYIRVFLDTGWEDETTYEYLNYLETVIGPIVKLKADIKIKRHKKTIQYFEDQLGYSSPMIRLMFQNLNYPRNFMRWCTKRLKIDVLKKYFDTLDFEPCNVVGIRKLESIARSKLKEHDYNDYLNCDVWRPIINWTEKQVIEIHHRNNVKPNSLYLNGSHRVGCYPCINSRKSEIKNLSKKRINLIHEIETKINILRQQKNKTACGFFKTKDRNQTLIHDVLNWARTSYGGKQYMLFDTTEPSCIKWGLCEYEGTK